MRPQGERPASESLRFSHVHSSNHFLNELLRNVVQHSRDPLGGVVGAQLSFGGRNTGKPAVQVVVADAGIGIPASLQSRHTSLSDPQEALEKALWPHFSSTFDEGETGNSQNAGMGLFFIAEMTKLVGGRLVIASRGATLILEGDENFENPHGATRFDGNHSTASQGANTPAGHKR